MKKLFTFCILFQFLVGFGQTVLTSFPLELKKSREYQQIVNAENTITHEVFVFASDKENITILKYNSALFLSTNITLERPDLKYKILVGYSFNEQGNPTLYWSSENLKKLIAVQYDLIAKTTSTTIFELPFANESIINQFQENNCFYILSSKNLEQKLILYIFKNGEKEEKTLDFSTFKFKNKKTEPITLNQILETYPIEKINANEFTPLFKSVQKTKMYVLKNRMLLTFDHNSMETQAFDIDLTTFEIQEKKFTPPVTKNPNGLGNSFFNDNKLYQFMTNEDELILEVKDYRSSAIIKTFQVNKEDTIAFKNSPFYLQIDGHQPKEFDNTSKFLKRLRSLNLGLSVYKTRNEILVTIGGTREGETNNLDALQFDDSLASSVAVLAGYLLTQSNPINLYFESVFDKKLQPSPQKQEPLAVDFISGFVNEHKEVTLQNAFRYKNYYIFGYYDPKAKQYIMRKFTDGFPNTFQ